MADSALPSRSLQTAIQFLTAAKKTTLKLVDLQPIMATGLTLAKDTPEFHRDNKYDED